MKELIREHSGNYCQTCTVKDSVKIGLCSRCIAESASYSLQEKKRDPLIDTMIDSQIIVEKSISRPNSGMRKRNRIPE